MPIIFNQLRFVDRITPEKTLTTLLHAELKTKGKVWMLFISAQSKPEYSIVRTSKRLKPIGPIVLVRKNAEGQWEDIDTVSNEQYPISGPSPLTGLTPAIRRKIIYVVEMSLNDIRKRIGNKLN